jgi:hypothetical protein
MVNLGRKYGTHDSSEWIAEGDGLLASARSMRAQWLLLRRAIHRKTSQSGLFQNTLSREWSKLVGMPRASTLLLGYAAEMYLKSGLIKIYTGCDENLIDSEVKLFGHDFVRIAKEISLPMDQNVKKQLAMLKYCVMVDARYPVKISHAPGKNMDAEYANSVNRRTDNMWSPKTFSALCTLVKSIRAYVQRLDGDESNPASFRRFDLPHGGYLVMRYGGNLQARITYRPEKGKILKRTVRDLEKLAIAADWTEAKFYWSRFIYMEVGTKGVKEMPSNVTWSIKCQKLLSSLRRKIITSLKRI